MAAAAQCFEPERVDSEGSDAYRRWDADCAIERPPAHVGAAGFELNSLNCGAKLMQEKHEGLPAAPTDLRLWLRLLSCVTSIEKRLRRNFAEQFGTTLPRFDVMASLDRFPNGQTMSELSRALLVSNGNVTAIVRQLESQKLVVIRADPRDRRFSIVALTERGKRQFDELASAHHEWIRALMKDFPLPKQRQLYELLADLKASLGRG